MRILVFCTLVLLFLASCVVARPKIDPTAEFKTQTGFRFRFAMPGEWQEGQSRAGQFTAGQKATGDGTTKVAVVRHGPLHTQGGVPMSNDEIFRIFRRDIEAEAKGGRVGAAGAVTSQFKRQKHNGADCMFFEQSGADQTAQGMMSLTNDGMICLHPKRPYTFIWMAISERRPLGKGRTAALEEDKKQLFATLDFI